MNDQQWLFFQRFHQTSRLAPIHNRGRTISKKFFFRHFLMFWSSYIRYQALLLVNLQFHHKNWLNIKNILECIISHRLKGALCSIITVNLKMKMHIRKKSSFLQMALHGKFWNMCCQLEIAFCPAWDFKLHITALSVLNPF